MTTFEITIGNGATRIFRGFFAPAFPHIKNLHDALQAHGGEAAKLVGKLGVWERSRQDTSSKW